MTAFRAKSFHFQLLLPSLAFILGLAGLPVDAARARAPLFKASAAGQDTLEVFCIYVQFKDETSLEDVATTTGLGTFGSAGLGKADSDKKQAYTLDPNGNLRRYRSYLEKHFEFANNYFENVSKGRVTVVPRIFPRPDADGRVNPIQLDRTMKQYNPSELDKGAKQKTSDFNEERAQRLMSFVWETVKAADDKDSLDNPFKTAFSEAKAGAGSGSRKHRCFLLFHAGHSRLLDGGQLGAFGADTPNDFTDFFVTQPDFKYLAKATRDGRKGGAPDSVKRRDSLGVKLRSVDTTITELMMMSESATQDKLNWGINGILVNQLARQMGMPDMFDVVQGISQLGYFDLMDFAGANSENGRGFLPVYPSAWVRYFMGWEEPVTARPGTGIAGGGGAFNDYKIWSPISKSDTGHTTTVKVPLNDREYLLVENRQRADASDKVKIYYSDRDGTGDFKFSKRDSVEVPFAFADSIFLDSLCDANGKKCKVNTLRPKGIITGASTYDLSLPASGMLVWRVNEWFIEQFLRYGAVNAYLGDTLRSQYKGVELVEADGSLTIGKRFKNQLGQDAFDYGSGSDMFPHIRRRRVNPPKDTAWRSVTDTINMIGPYGQANTNAWNDGRTHLRLEAPIPANALLERGVSDFLGDSVFNVRDSALTLRVHWPDNRSLTRAPGWEWPAKADTATLSQSLSVVKGAAGAKLVVSLSDSGRTQPYLPTGRLAVEPIATLNPNAAGYDSVKTLLPGGKSRDDDPVPVGSLAGRLGRALGSAVWNDTLLAVLTAERLALITLRSDSLATRSRDSSARVRIGSVPGGVGPVVAGNLLWILTRDGTAVAFKEDGSPSFSISMPTGEWQSLALAPSGTGPTASLVAAGAGGKAVLIDAAAREAVSLDVPWGQVKPADGEAFTVATADFDRNGTVDVFLLGSKGSAVLFSLKDAPSVKAFTGFPQRFSRSLRFADTDRPDGGIRYESDDRSGPALADLDRDGHPDILFSGTNGVHAVNFRGAYLKGWPFLLEERQAVGFTYGGSLFPETAIRSTPLVASLDGHPTVLIGSPDGLIHAVDSAGRRLKGSKPDASVLRNTGILASDVSDWPLTMGGLSLDTARNPYLQLALADIDGDADLELLAQSGTGSLNAWTLKKARPAQGLDWLTGGGNQGRGNFLDVSAWQAAAPAGANESIQEFYLFPSPVRGATATVHLKLGKAARKARIRIYDVAGVVVKDQAWETLTEGLQAYTQILNLGHLGPDVYSALVEVWFEGGKKQKWERFGVIR